MQHCVVRPACLLLWLPAPQPVSHVRGNDVWHNETHKLRIPPPQGQSFPQFASELRHMPFFFQAPFLAFQLVDRPSSSSPYTSTPLIQLAKTLSVDIRQHSARNKLAFPMAGHGGLSAY